MIKRKQQITIQFPGAVENTKNTKYNLNKYKKAEHI